MSELKKYWLNLQPRERMILAYGGLAVSAILLYAQLFQPFYNAITHMEQALPGLRSNLVWMRQTDEMLKRGGNLTVSQATEGSNESLLSVLESTARGAKIRESIQQLVPTKNNTEVRVVLQDADFNKWLLWVDTLYKKKGIDIRQVTAERDDDRPNIAEIRVTFFRP
ncbi:MAG: general secretion pathway protein M [Arenicella sp.]|jgi:general secretion pathway protein M